MAQNERNLPDPVHDESADTASFQRFVAQQEPNRGADNRQSFRLLSLLVGVIVLIVLIGLLLR